MSNSTIDSILFWISIGEKYIKIKEDPERRDTSVSMGTTSLILSIVGAVVTYGLAVVAYLCFVAGGVGKIIGGIFAVLFALASFIYMMIASIVYAAFQVKLNKKPIGKAALIISLVLTITPIIAGVVALIISLQ